MKKNTIMQKNIIKKRKKLLCAHTMSRMIFKVKSLESVVSGECKVMAQEA